MNAVRNVLLLATLSAIAAAQSNPPAAAEQRFFNLEDAVQHPVELSAAELAALAGDDLMRKTVVSAIPGAALTQDGLTASIVHLCDPQERDLLIMGSGSQFVGENNGPFWIVRDLPTGPVIVLSEMSLALSVQPKRSKQCFNLQAIAVTATQSTTTDFSFDGDKYVISKQKTAKLPHR